MQSENHNKKSNPMSNVFTILTSCLALGYCLGNISKRKKDKDKDKDIKYQTGVVTVAYNLGCKGYELGYRNYEGYYRHIVFDDQRKIAEVIKNFNDKSINTVDWFINKATMDAAQEMQKGNIKPDSPWICTFMITNGYVTNIITM